MDCNVDCIYGSSVHPTEIAAQSLGIAKDKRLDESNAIKVIPLKSQARIVRRLANTMQRINHNPVGKCQQNKPRYPRDSDLSGR